ncbi:hypothetical protein SJZ82_06890 [Serratia marcescens]|uniref:hypothetical protein n=1 Tax=Serratia marcescens TaxID=615 RepID=UPI0029DD9BEC|nr:hypothetical protein [Serratia marcescens]MDX6800905.1 hypothetical protein [Serratia marcescens]
MDNKLIELSKPVAWKFKNADGGDRVSLERKANIYGRHDFQPLCSQEYVSALLASIDGMSQTINVANDATRIWKERALAAEAFRDQMLKYVRALGSSAISPSVVETILNAAERSKAGK